MGVAQCTTTWPAQHVSVEGQPFSVQMPLFGATIQQQQPLLLTSSRYVLAHVPGVVLGFRLQAGAPPEPPEDAPPPPVEVAPPPPIAVAPPPPVAVAPPPPVAVAPPPPVAVAPPPPDEVVPALDVDPE